MKQLNSVVEVGWIFAQVAGVSKGAGIGEKGIDVVSDCVEAGTGWFEVLDD